MSGQDRRSQTGSGGHRVATSTEMQEAAWAAIKDRPEFIAVDLCGAVGGSEAWARRVVRRWRDAGRITAIRQDGQTLIWRAAEPREPASAYTRERQRPEFAMWRTMRQLRRFSAADVHLTANTGGEMTVADVQKYCSALAEAGYLKVAIKGKLGARAPIYALRGHPGPFPPRVMRVPAIYDPNDKSFAILERRVRT